MMMDNNLGKIRIFEVIRETQLGYMLSDGDNEYFLHRNETNYQNLLIGERVKAFIYTDKKGRFAATLYSPTMTLDKIGFGTIVDTNYNIGAFINIGISKDVLLSRDDFPEDYSLWPNPEDKIACKLRIQGVRLLAKPSTKTEFLEVEKKELTNGQKVDAYVYRITPSGLNLVTEDFNVIFVYKTEIRKKYRLGEKVETVIVKRNLDDYDGSLSHNKEAIILSDREKILKYLNQNYGAMAITEKSDALVIDKVFKMSKKAFKNALGGLYKDGLIEIHPDKIVLL